MHKVLAHSYAMHLLLFLIGVVLDVVFGIRVLMDPWAVAAGALLLLVGSILVFWAQNTSRHLDIENPTKETFRHGPYRFTRTPTNFGLFFLALGFGVVANAFFVIMTSFLAFVTAKFFFLAKEEKILADKYGAPYLEYKKSVKF